GVILDHEFELPTAEDAAAGVHVLDAHLGAAHDELSGRRVAGRREWREHADRYGLLRGDCSAGGRQQKPGGEEGQQGSSRCHLPHSRAPRKWARRYYAERFWGVN